MLLTNIQSTETSWNVGMPMTGVLKIRKVTCRDTDMEGSATLRATPQFHSALQYGLSLALVSMSASLHVTILCTPLQYMHSCLCALYTCEQHPYISSLREFLISLVYVCGQSFLFSLVLHVQGGEHVV